MYFKQNKKKNTRLLKVTKMVVYKTTVLLSLALASIPLLCWAAGVQ